MYPFVGNKETILQELKREALLRRSNKLISWMQRPEYSVYNDQNSITDLIKLIDLIIWALEKSLPLHQWRPFRNQFIEARNSVLAIVNTPEEEKDNFYTAIPIVISTLQGYAEFIATKQITTTVE